MTAAGASLYSVLACLPAMARTSTAQSVSRGRVQGVVYVSVSRRPLSQATVQLLRVGSDSGMRTAEADSAGRFRVDSVTAGDSLVGAWHARLDSVGLTQLARSGPRRRFAVCPLRGAPWRSTSPLVKAASTWRAEFPQIRASRFRPVPAPTRAVCSTYRRMHRGYDDSTSSSPYHNVVPIRRSCACNGVLLRANRLRLAAN